MPPRLLQRLLAVGAAASLVWALSIAVPAQAATTCLGKPGTIIGDSSGEAIDGTAGNDVIVGNGGRDIIDGGGGNDVICGNGGNDTLRGGDGGDVLSGGPGSDIHEGGTGFDTADYSDRGVPITVKVNKTADDGAAGEGDTVKATVERLVGGSVDDFLKGGRGPSTLVGNGGNDTLDGAAGDDTLDGGPGNDDLRGSAADDLLIGGIGDDTQNGGTEDDVLAQATYTTTSSDMTDMAPTLIRDDGLAQTFLLNVPAGEVRDINVRIDVSHPAPSELKITLQAPGGIPGHEYITLAQNVTDNGTQFTGATFDSEAFRGVQNGVPNYGGRFHAKGSLDNAYRGIEGGGTWRLRVYDQVPGNQGTLNWWSVEIATPQGADGQDGLAGGDGLHDLVDYASRSANVALSFGADADGESGEGDTAGDDLEDAQMGTGSDEVSGNDAGNELRGWLGGDTISGGGAHDEIQGNEGGDILSGGLGGDDVDGNEGNDEIHGGEGNDNLDGGPDTDTIDGGPGTDICTNGETLSNCP